MAPAAIAHRSLPRAGKHVIIGQDYKTRTDVAVGNMQREGGFYVLGQPRTRKSTLLVSMALQDIKNGHGLLFIDPHYDAINNLLARIPNQRLQDVILLDPSDNSHRAPAEHCGHTVT